MKKGDIIIVIISMILLVLLFAGYKLFIMNIGDARYVEISVNNKLYQRIALTEETNIVYRIEQDKNTNDIRVYKNDSLIITEKNNYNIAYNNAYNIIAIKNGGIQIVEDNTPYQDAVRKGFTKVPYDPLISLPFRLEVVIVGEQLENTDIDGVAY